MVCSIFFFFKPHATCVSHNNIKPTSRWAKAHQWPHSIFLPSCQSWCYAGSNAPLFIATSWATVNVHKQNRGNVSSLTSVERGGWSKTAWFDYFRNWRFSYALEFTQNGAMNSTGSVGGNVFSTRGGQSRTDSSAPTGRLLKLNHSGVPDCILIAVIILLSNKMLLVLLPKV